MSTRVTQPKYSFGLKAEVSNNVVYLDEQSLIYPAGTNLIIYNIDQRTQKFLPFGSGGEGATAMAVSPNKRYAAIAEKRQDKPTITVFDLHTMRKRKTLSCADMTSLEFVSIAFSPDSKYLISQGSSPDWMLVYWYWEKAKIMASTKVSGPQNTSVHQVLSKSVYRTIMHTKTKTSHYNIHFLSSVCIRRSHSIPKTALRSVLSVRNCSNCFVTARET